MVAVTRAVEEESRDCGGSDTGCRGGEQGCSCRCAALTLLD